MNRQKLNEIIENYISQYELVNGSENDELFKWRAAASMYGMTPHADDFLDRFKVSARPMSMLCSDELWYPCNGIFELCDPGKANLSNDVRTAFKTLFAETDSDIINRGENIASFIEFINEMLGFCMPRASVKSYEQDYRSALTYLGLMRPDKDFMFEKEAAEHFSQYTEFIGKIWNKNTLNVEAYYNMCEELISVIKENDTLMKMVADRLEYDQTCSDYEYPVNLTEIDSRYHILAFDIIHCTEKYGFYVEHPITKKPRMSAARKKTEDKKNHIQNNIYVIQKHIQTASDKLQELESLELTGMTVHHKKFGEGTVRVHDGDRLTIDFACGEKILSLKTAFSRGIITVDDEHITDVCSKILDVEEKVKGLQIRQRVKELELEKIV